MLAAVVLTALQEPLPLAFYIDEKTKAQVISVNLKSQRLRFGVIVPPDFPGTDESFTSMIKRENPVAAINGTYFAKDTLNPIGDIMVDGQLLHSGRMGTALTITADRKLDIQRVVRHKTYDWKGFQTVLACGPALMQDGEIDVDWRAEGFRDPHVTGRTARMGLGYTNSARLLLVRIPKAVSFEEMAQIMKKLGCHEAMNLDAGASTGMYFNGKYIVKPSRELTNVLGIWVTG